MVFREYCGVVAAGVAIVFLAYLKPGAFAVK
jgi:hypothetical protein